MRARRSKSLRHGHRRRRPRGPDRHALGGRAASSTTPCLLLDGGKIAGRTFKHDLPNYGVFDEKRVFAPGPLPGPLNVRGVRIGVPICEDIWTPEVVRVPGRDRRGNPAGAQRLALRSGQGRCAPQSGRRARDAKRGLPLIYLNQVGGQDELVFDGASLRASTPTARWRWRCRPGEEKRRRHRMDARDGRQMGLRAGRTRAARRSARSAGLSRHDAGPARLCEQEPLSRRGAGPVRRHRFRAVGGGGGGCAGRGARALRDAAVALHQRRKASTTPTNAPSCWACPTRPSRSSARWPPSATRWRRSSPATRADTTEENIQSRIRGVILMAISNKFGPMVLTTGNKSEMSVGYATLYGDMCGGYNVLKDVYKTEVFRLSRWRNQHAPARRAGTAGPRDPRAHHHQAADAPSCAPTRPTRIPCRPTRSWTAFSNAWSRRR